MGKLYLKPIDAGVNPEQIQTAVTEYLIVNPVSADEPLLAQHILDPTPHQIYDNLAAGRFLAHLQNGMA